MASRSERAEKILARLKGLRDRLQAGEEPLFMVPAIWDGGQGQRSMPCDVVVTNQRVMGYVFVSFPRERVFFDALSLTQIAAVTLRRKAYEPLFRELLIRNGGRRVYIRAPQRKIEELYAALRATIEKYVPTAQTAFDEEQGGSAEQVSPIYGRQEIQAPFERSSLAIVLLFIGGLVLELSGAALYLATRSVQVGLPLFVAGLVAAITGILMRRQRK